MSEDQKTQHEEVTPGDVSVFFEDGRTVILLRGNIDLSVAEDLEHAGRDAIDSGLDIYADVRDIESIDSVGVSFLLRLAGNARSLDTRVVLIGPSPRVAELLTLLEADGLFTWTEDPKADD